MASVLGSRSRRAHVGAFLVTALVIVGVGAPSAFASSSTPKKKKLSLTTITLSSPQVPASEVNWVAQYQGFFKRQGLDFIYQSGASNAAQLAAIVAGAVQFIVNSPISDLPAVSQGAPLRGIMQTSLNTPNELVITQTEATQFHVPAIANNAAGALAQLEALKGSHVTVGISNATSSSFGALLYLVQQHGMTGGLSCATCDFNFQSLGSTANLTTGIQANKIQGLVNVPPVSVIPTTTPTVTIPMWRIPPEPDLSADYLVTTSTMVAQHPDTVQAVTNAMLQAFFFIKSHPKQTEKDLALGLANYSAITSPEEQDYLYAGYVPFFKAPYPSRRGFDVAVALNNVTSTTPNPVNYSHFVITRFINQAVKTLHVNLAQL